MNVSPRSKVLIAVVALAAIVAVCFLQSNGVETKDRDTGDEQGPPISPTGPYPSVAVDDAEAQLGVMLVGPELEHTFVVGNEGEAPLILRKYGQSPNCTGVEFLDDPESVPAGGSARIRLKWRFERDSSQAMAGVVLKTNDPDRRNLELRIAGSAEKAVRIDPEPDNEWDAGKIPEGEPTIIEAALYSRAVESFDVPEQIPGPASWLTATATPLGAQRLQELEARCGYALKVAIKPEMKFGPFRAKLRIPTDIPGLASMKSVTIPMRGVRRGPFDFLPVGTGFQWRPDDFYLDLGRFAAADGAKATLLMFVTLPEDGNFEILGTRVDPGFLNVAVVPSPDSECVRGKKCYRLTVTMPPGSPRGSRDVLDPAQIVLKTTHPDAPEVVLYVQFSAT